MRPYRKKDRVMDVKVEEASEGIVLKRRVQASLFSGEVVTSVLLILQWC